MWGGEGGGIWRWLLGDIQLCVDRTKVNTVLTKVNTVLTKVNTVLTKVNTVLTKVNTILTKVNTVLKEININKTTPQTRKRIERLFSAAVL